MRHSVFSATRMRADRIRADLASGKAREERIALRPRVTGAEVARELQRRGHPVTPQAVFYWETGKNEPTVEHALAYGRLLDDLKAKRPT